MPRSALWLCLVAACTSRPIAGPRAVSIEPASGRAGVPLGVTIHGQGFTPTPAVDFSAGSIDVDSQFRAWLGDTALDEVRLVDSSSLAATVPPTLAVGVYDLRVETPSGAPASLAAAFAVTPDRLVITRTAGADAAEIGAVELHVGQSVTLFAQTYGIGTYVGPVAATWTLSGAIGTLSATEGPSVDLTAEAAGTGTVSAAALDGLGDTTGDITVAECDSAADCLDANPCNGDEQCQQGRCVPGTPLACVSTNPCVDAWCDPVLGCVTGLSTAPQCTLPPVVSVTVTPAAIEAGATVTADASGTTDDHDPLSALSFAWDWGEPGGPGLVPGSVTETHVYQTPGQYTLTVQATDSGGSAGIATVDLVVASPSQVIVVTTGADEADAGATPTDPNPGNPGGTGLSLREALAYAATTPGRDVIVFALPAPQTQVELGSTLVVQTDADGVDVLGDGVTLTSSAAGQADCVSIQGSGIYLSGLEITGCPRYAVNLVSGTGNQVAHCSIHNNGNTVLYGAAGNTFGPGNEVSFPTGKGIDGVRVDAQGVVIGNRLHDNSGNGIFLNQNQSGSSVWQNVVYRNGGSGVFLSLAVTSTSVWLNTVAANGSYGLRFGSPTTSANDVRDNVVSGNAGYGMFGVAANFSTEDYNAFFQNTGGDCSSCTIGAHSLSGQDPRFAAPATGDYRLDPDSPLIDAGVDVGVDVNGPQAGSYNGTAPDIGAWESP